MSPSDIRVFERIEYLILEHFSHKKFLSHDYASFPDFNGTIPGLITSISTNDFNYTIPGLVTCISADDDSIVYNSLGYKCCYPQSSGEQVRCDSRAAPHVPGPTTLSQITTGLSIPGEGEWWSTVLRPSSHPNDHGNTHIVMLYTLC
jgi:hypothetical protein